MIFQAIITGVAALGVASLTLGRYTASLAYALVLAGVVATKAIPGAQEGVFGFAIWCLVGALIVRRFPVAALLFIASGLCYTVDSIAALAYPAQVAANLLGVAGLAGIWFERRRDIVGGHSGRPMDSGRGALGAGVPASGGRDSVSISEADE